MTGAADLLAALKLPAGTRVDQRVPKKLLLENGAPTAVDKRAINDGVDEIRWLAAIKPATAGVPAYHDAAREYLEIAIVQAHWRDGAKIARLTELIHRAIPYPVVLVAEQDGAPSVSLAHKRWAQNEAGKTVLDGEVESARLVDTEPNVAEAFLCSLALAQQPRGSMWIAAGKAASRRCKPLNSQAGSSWSIPTSARPRAAPPYVACSNCASASRNCAARR
jgi:hypothetical protein